MRRASVVVGLLALFALTGSAAGHSGPSKAHHFLVRGSGTLTNAGSQNSFSGTVTGTRIGRGTFSGVSKVVVLPPPQCGTAPGAPASGSNTLTAANGDTLRYSFSGTVCQSAATSASTTYKLTATYTITGGTGRFTDASGTGAALATITLFVNTGPLTIELRGTIELHRVKPPPPRFTG
jgi:hypothetical protein